MLAESDDMWVALRHKHFAAATIEITRTLDEFRAKNKAAAYKQGSGGDGGLDMRNMRSLVSSLPQYRYAKHCKPCCFIRPSPCNNSIEESSINMSGSSSTDTRTSVVNTAASLVAGSLVSVLPPMVIQC